MENEIAIERAEHSADHSRPAASAGCCGHHQFERPTQVLSEEHRVIERALAVLEKLTRVPVEESLVSWKKALDFIRHFADQCHHLKEEKVLFPALEEHGIPREGGPIGMMLLEHEEGRGYVRGMMAAVKLCAEEIEAGKEMLVDNAQSYLRLLREHIQKEDEILFRMADEVITVDEQKALLQKFEQQETTEIGEGVHQKYLRLVEELENALSVT